MWATVVVLALVAASDPVRLGIVLLLISRPRPMANLFTYWLGAMTVGVATALIFIMGMRDLLPEVMQNIAVVSARPLARYVQIAIGLLLLLIAISIAGALTARQRPSITLLAADTSAAVPQSGSHNPVSRLLGAAREALNGGSSWVAFVVGLGSGPPPAECLAAFAVILASGAAVHTQVSAGIAFIVVMLIGFEITLISSVVTPAKTEAVVLRLHNWLRARRHHLFAIIIAVLGFGLLANGMAGG